MLGGFDNPDFSWQDHFVSTFQESEAISDIISVGFFIKWYFVQLYQLQYKSDVMMVLSEDVVVKIDGQLWNKWKIFADANDVHEGFMCLALVC